MEARSKIGRVADAITDAAKATAEAANDYVVQPVGKTLGLVTETPKPRSKSEVKAARKVAARDEAAQRRAGK